MSSATTKYKIAPARSSSGKRSARNGKKDPNQALKDTLKAREDDVTRLSQELETLKDAISALMTENKSLKNRYTSVVKHVLSYQQSEVLGQMLGVLNPVGGTAAATDMTTDDDTVRALAVDLDIVLKTVSKLADDRTETLRKRSTIETRVEELETRLTDQSLQLARLAACNTYCASVVDDTLEDSVSLADMREKLNGLQQNLAMEHPLLADPRSVPVFTLEPVADDHERQLSLLLAAESRSLPYALGKPVVKLAGDTHIKAMNHDLRNFVMRELSMERASGADWRALAERVGISAATIDSWRHLRLPCPMSQVLAFWGDSSGATVRMLHRHLVSPQLRAIVVARRISDFYDVD